MEVDGRTNSEIRQPIYTKFRRKIFSIATFWFFIIPYRKRRTVQLVLCFIWPLTSLCATETGSLEKVPWARFKQPSVKGEPITVELATKPVLFAHDVVLVCTVETAETHSQMTWIKIPNGETLALNNITADNAKYLIDIKCESSATKYTLTIKKFAQSDVNRHYRCDSGFLSRNVNLQLNKEDYIAIPEKNEMERNISLNDGYLRGSIQVNSVYPALSYCAAMFEGDNITSQLKIANSSTTSDSIFYNMVIEISHQTVKCKGMINVTCSVGIKRIPLMAQDIDECLKQMQNKGFLPLMLGLSPAIVSLVVCFFCIIPNLQKRLKKKKDQLNLKKQNTAQRDEELSSEESITLESSFRETDI